VFEGENFNMKQTSKKVKIVLSVMFYLLITCCLFLADVHADTITKGIYLIGAGIGNTTISGGFTITYKPSDFSANEPFRISGFTFSGGSIKLDGASERTYCITKVRIDHIKFTNVSGQAITNFGMRGVVDNNIFDNISYPIRASYANYQEDWWQNWEHIVYGKMDNNMYFEDNVFSGISTLVSDCQYGNRYVFRYNTINTLGGWQGLFDMHRTCFGGEIYGNQNNAASGCYTIRILDDRGGKAIVFYNNSDGAGINSLDIQVRTESNWDDPVTERVNDTYYWVNRKNLTGATNTATEAGHVGDHPLINRDYFNYTASFNGTSGVGCGTLANRPATCTQGVGYWATNQSCSDLTGMVGAHPATPISGTLYKCTAPNTWTAYFTPLSYPHPLVTGEDPPPPPPPDTTPPSDITSVNDGTGGDVDFTYSTTELSANWTPSTDDESSISKYWYAIGTTAGGTDTAEWTSTSNGTVTSVTRSGLTLSVGTTYYFTVKAENGVLLQSNSKSSDGQAVIEGTDDTPPVISNISATNITGTGVTITWDTDEPATSQVQYGPSAVSYGSISNENSDLNTGHSISITGLTPETLYHYTVISRDAIGNESISLDKTFATLSETEEPKEEIDAKAYPNPYSPSKGNSMRFSVDTTTGGEVKIYTISGKLVKKLLIASGESEVDWNVLNEEGNDIIAGLYLYTVTDGNGNKKTGKLAISN
jgi:hypothetical protein